MQACMHAQGKCLFSTVVRVGELRTPKPTHQHTMALSILKHHLSALIEKEAFLCISNASHAYLPRVSTHAGSLHAMTAVHTLSLTQIQTFASFSQDPSANAP
jgi:hypothetical protein